MYVNDSNNHMIPSDNKNDINNCRKYHITDNYANCVHLPCISDVQSTFVETFCVNTVVGTLERSGMFVSLGTLYIALWGGGIFKDQLGRNRTTIQSTWLTFIILWIYIPNILFFFYSVTFSKSLG